MCLIVIGIVELCKNRNSECDHTEVDITLPDGTQEDVIISSRRAVGEEHEPVVSSRSARPFALIDEPEDLSGLSTQETFGATDGVGLGVDAPASEDLKLKANKRGFNAQLTEMGRTDTKGKYQVVGLQTSVAHQLFSGGSAGLKVEFDQNCWVPFNTTDAYTEARNQARADATRR